MRYAFALFVMTCRAAVLSAAAEISSAPPLPSPMVPSAADRPPLPLPLPGAAEESASAPTREAGRQSEVDDPPKIILQEKVSSIIPVWHGAGVNDAVKIAVKVGGSKLTATLNAAAYAHCYLGGHSAGVPVLRLVQEFDVTPGNPKDPRVVLTLSGKLDGYVRSESHGSAALKLADAAVYPACGGPTLCLGFPSCGITGGGSRRCMGEIELPPLTVPAGRYILVANLIPEATVEGIFHGHAEAVFAPGNRVSTWDSEGNPLADVGSKDFGMVITVKVAAPQAGQSQVAGSHAITPR